MHSLRQRLLIALSGALIGSTVAGCGAPASTPRPSSTSQVSAPDSSTPRQTLATDSVIRNSAGAAVAVPRFDHVVVVVEENHAFGQVIGSANAPFITHLASTGVTLTQSYAVTHPSEPNYLALFSGSTQGLTSDSCPHQFTGANLATALFGAGGSFTGYSQSLPSPGYTGCSAGPYARKHNPWVDFPAIPARDNQAMTAFPTNYADLPTMAFVIPDLDHDMHDGTVASADTWLKDHLSGYAAWAPSHNSLLIITADEDDTAHDNHIPTLLAGAHLKRGPDSQRVDHYAILRTLLDAYRLPATGHAAAATPLTGIWTS